jgi:hypothetical protein
LICAIGTILSRKLFSGNAVHLPCIIFNIGNLSISGPFLILPGPIGELFVGIDTTNNTVTGVIYNPEQPLQNLIDSNVNYTILVERDFVAILVRDYCGMKAIGMDVSRITDEFNRAGVIYNAETNDLTISSRSPYYNITGPLKFSAFGKYLG